MDPCNRPLIATVLLCAWIASPALASAADLSSALTDYNVTAWGDKDGLPRGTIRALAQDRDGYLWIGTEYGLVRFDGARFLTWEALGHQPLPAAAVTTLRVTGDGSLWVGFDNPAGLVRIRGSQVQAFTAVDGWPNGSVQGIVEDVAGVIWAAHSTGLYRFADNRWEREPSVPAGRVRKVHAGATGSVFAVLDQSVVVRRSGSTGFERIETPERYISGIHEDAAGHVWMADTFVGVMTDFAVGVKRVTVRGPAGVGTSVMPDATGGLWIGTAGQGLWYARRPLPGKELVIETVTTLTGLSNDIVNVMLEDRDGNIWAGTADGLNRLRRHPFTTVADLSVVIGLDTSPDGAVWTATSNTLVRFAAGVSGRRETASLPEPARAMHVDGSGDIWIASDNGVWRYSRTPSGIRPTRVTDALTRVREIASDSHGHTWFYDLERGVGRWDGSHLDVMPMPVQYRSALVCALEADSHGQIWVGLRQQGALAIAPDHTVTFYGPAEGLDVGSCTDIYEDVHRTLWVLGVHGVSRLVNGRFTTLRGPGDIPLENVHGMAFDAAGDLWLNSQSSIARMQSADLEQAFAGRWDRVRANVYNASSGVAGTSARVGHSAIRTADGTLWFLTSRGVTLVDPRSVDETSASVPVHIDNVVIDDRRSAGTIASIPPRSRRLEVEYSLPTLSPGRRPRLRYRLDGFDTAWHEALPNQRRLAYTNLPPQSYTLRIQDVAPDGTVRSTDTWDFAVRPAFYQTTWFAIVSLVAVGGIASLAWRHRLRQVRGEFALLLKERVRLSREIHDTVLQSLIGLSLQLEQVEHDVDASSAGKQRLRRARRQVEEYIREARESIWNLRSSTLEREGLAAALRHAGERAVAEARDADRSIEWRFDIVGTPDRCAPDIEEQLLKIGQEAVTNATRHSAAQNISVELRYDDANVALRVSDDGRGFDLTDAHNGHRSHWGLVNMRERAEAAGGTLHLSSVPGEGTEVSAVVPRTASRHA